MSVATLTSTKFILLMIPSSTVAITLWENEQTLLHLHEHEIHTSDTHDKKERTQVKKYYDYDGTPVMSGRRI